MSKKMVRTISLIVALALAFGTFNSGQAESNQSPTVLTFVSEADTPTTLSTTSQTVLSTILTTGSGMWISSAEIMSLPISGAAWDGVRTAAYGSWGTADLQNDENRHATYVLAGALVFARTGDASLRGKVRDAILAAKRSLDEVSEWQTTNGVLAAGRQIGTYVISADLIDLTNYDPITDQEFRTWLIAIRTTNIGTHGRWKALTYTCENAAGNWNTFACASRIAASIYVGDMADVDRAANIIRAFLGERAYYPANAPGSNGYFEHTAGYQASWSCAGVPWTGINSVCTSSGINIDGVLVEDGSRGGGCCVLQGDGVSYSWEALQGLFVSTELLYRTGRYGNPYGWSNQALKRSLDFMQRSGWGISNVAKYVPWIANARYGTSYPTAANITGRIMSWGDWLYKTLPISGNVGVSGVMLRYIDNTAKTVTSDVSGDYSIGVPHGWSGTVAPSKACYTFSPSNRLYSSVSNNQANQNYAATFEADSGCAKVDVTIAGQFKGNSTVPLRDRVTPIYNDVNNGPVQVVSTNEVSIITSERAYRGPNYTDWNEMIGFPANQLTTEYWFPLCDGTGGAQTFLSIGNVSQSTAQVTVKIAGQVFGSYTIPVGGRVTPNCAGINNGPVQVHSTNGMDIIVSERAYRGPNYTDWNEMIGLPVEQLTTEYWFPLCDGTNGAQTFISIGNAGQSTAEVTVKIAGQVLENYTIPVGGRVAPNCAGINNGPVQVYSTNEVSIITSERAYRGPNYTDWNEMIGFPADQLTTEYWFPVCDGTGGAQTFLSIGNVSQSTAQVTVKIAGQVFGSYAIPVGGYVTPNCAGINNGPVQVYSTNGMDIIVSERAYRGPNYTDWNEMLGLPVEQLTTEYWFPVYDTTGIAQTFLSIGNAGP